MVKRIFAMVLALTLLAAMSVFAQDVAPAPQEPEEVTARKSDVIFLQIGNYATVSNGTLKWVDAENRNVLPYIKDGRTMVPLRFLAEEMGATVGYDESTRSITVSLDNTVLQLQVGQAEYSVNGEAFLMDCAAEISEDRTFVPVRFVSEALGKSVEWLNDERIVVVTPQDAPWDMESDLEKAVLAEVRLNLSPLGRNNVE